MRGFFSLLALLFFATASNAGYVVFYENGKAGIRDDAGKIILPASFDALGWTDNSFSVINQVTGYRKQSRWGLINLRKEFITKAEYETLTSAGGDRVVASKQINPYSRKFGCIDLTGKVMVPFHYDGISISGLRAVVFVKNGTRYEHGVIDLFDKSIIPMKFRDIRALGTLRFAVQDFTLKTALYSEEGTRLTEFSIDSIATFYKGKAVIYEGVRQGLIDRDGTIVIPPSMRAISIDAEGKVNTRGFDVWQQVNASNQPLASIEADNIVADDQNYRVQLSDVHGVVDHDFREIVPLGYSFLGPFTNHLAVARKGSRYGLISKSGKPVIPFEFDTLVLENNFVRARSSTGGISSWLVYDTFGIRKSPRQYDFIGSFNGKFFPAKHHGFWGAFDRYGNEVLACVYDSLLDFNQDVAAVQFKNLYGILDYGEKWIVLPQRYPLRLATGRLFFLQQDTITFLRNFDNEILYFTTSPLSVRDGQIQEQAPQGVVRIITEQGLINTVVAPPVVEDAEVVYEEHEGMRGIKRSGRFGFIDSRGRLRVANRYEAIGKFSEGLAAVMIMGRWGFVNREDKIAINPNYDFTDGFQDHVTIVGRDGKMGVIGRDGKVVLPIRYDSVSRAGDRFILYQEDRLGLSTAEGHVLIEPRFDALQVIDEKTVVVASDRRWGVVTHEGLPVIPMMYDGMKYDPATKKFLVVTRATWTPANF